MSSTSAPKRFDAAGADEGDGLVEPALVAFGGFIPRPAGRLVHRADVGGLGGGRRPDVRRVVVVHGRKLARSGARCVARLNSSCVRNDLALRYRDIARPGARTSPPSSSKTSPSCRGSRSRIRRSRAARRPARSPRRRAASKGRASRSGGLRQRRTRRPGSVHPSRPDGRGRVRAGRAEGHADGIRTAASRPSTYMIDGTFEHSDSNGGGGVITQRRHAWMTAGAGILHIEKPPEALVTSGGLFHGFQLWVNLPDLAEVAGLDALARPSAPARSRVDLRSGRWLARWSGRSPATSPRLRRVRGRTPRPMTCALAREPSALSLPGADYNALESAWSGQGRSGRRPDRDGQWPSSARVTPSRRCGLRTRPSPAKTLHL